MVFRDDRIKGPFFKGILTTEVGNGEKPPGDGWVAYQASNYYALARYANSLNIF
jgi:hypothetical protein